MSITHPSGPPPLTFPTGAEVILAPGADHTTWKQTRNTGIGGSDIAAICGINPYTSPLEIWLAKVGTPVPRRDNPTLDEAAEMGHELEPVIARRFTKMTSLPALEGLGTLRHPQHPWMLGNLDRATVEDGQLGVLELKSRSSYALSDWIERAPVDVEVQVQWYMAVTGWPYAWIACLIGGQRTIVHRLERDEQMIRDLTVIGEEFWGWVTNRQQPPIDGSEATGQLLDRLHANPTSEFVVADATEVEQLLRQRQHAKEQIAGAQTALTDAENQLKHIAGDAVEVHIRGEKAYSWPRYERRGAIDFKALTEDHPDVDIDAYRKTNTTYRTLRIHLENL